MNARSGEGAWAWAATGRGSYRLREPPTLRAILAGQALRFASCRRAMPRCRTNGSQDELRDRPVGPRCADHRRFERARNAVREDLGALGRRGGARRAAHRAPEDAACGDRGQRRRCARGHGRRDRLRQHPGRGGPRRDRDGCDRHPGQQLGREHDSEDRRCDRRRLRLRLRHQHQGRLLHGAGGGQADAGTCQGCGARNLHRRAHRQHRFDGRTARRWARSASTA